MNLGKIGTDLDDSNLSVLGDAPDQLQANKTIAFKRPTSLPIFQYTGNLLLFFALEITMHPACGG